MSRIRLLLATTLVVGFLYVLLGGAQPAAVIHPVATIDPGHEESASGYWCVSAGIPSAHRPEYPGGIGDHPCTPDELDGNCDVWRVSLQGSEPKPSYCP